MSEQLKQCTAKEKCINSLGCWLPATAEYFHRDKKKSDGLCSRCRECVNQWHRDYTKSNPEKFKAARQANAEKYPGRQKEHVRRYKEKRKREGLSAHNPIDKEKSRAYSRKYYAAHREQEIQRSRERQLRNPELARQRAAKWKRKHPEFSRLKDIRRRARKRGLPDDFTAADWSRCLDYFHGCCAACSRPLRDLFGTHTASADHWIPLVSPDCPGTIPVNIVPLCHGVNGCNNHKSNKNPNQWLIEQFGKRRAREILKRIETYFEWVKQFED
jgi:hypothetical protein